MSAKNVADCTHYSFVFMRPFTRGLAIAAAAYISYILITPSKFCERIPPNYEAIRRQKQLPDIPVKHPAGMFGKGYRIIPDEELVIRTRN